MNKGRSFGERWQNSFCPLKPKREKTWYQEWEETIPGMPFHRRLEQARSKDFTKIFTENQKQRD